MRHRILGVVFVLLLTTALSASVLQYRKVFTPVAWVTLYTGHTGLQLNQGAEVKLRGVVVGEVRQISSDGDRAKLRLALDPEVIGRIPAGVSARLLPKTLFGERYVALIPPAGESTGSLHAGAVIEQDRSRSAVELEQVLDDALPLLQAIRPERLATILGVLAEALQGRGDELGKTLVLADNYLRELNQDLPMITEDVRRLADVLADYEGALPDLLAILRDATVSARTIVDQRTQLATFLAESINAADVTRSFLERHDEQLIRIGTVSRPVLELLATYAPEYPCLMRGLVALQPRAEEVFRGGRMHVTMEITRDNGKYQRGRDEPVYGARNGPDCRGLPNPPKPAPQVPINDGYDYSGGRSSTPPLPVGLVSTPSRTPAPSPEMGYAGTTEERDLIRPLVATATGALPVEVPDIAVLLWGPLLRGAVVNLP